MIKPQVEKDVEMWPEQRIRGSKFAWLAEIEVGDSFSISPEDVGRVMSAVQSGKMASWLPSEYKLSRRAESETSVRVWRVS
jgi:hypothetical protein